MIVLVQNIKVAAKPLILFTNNVREYYGIDLMARRKPVDS